MPLTPTLFKGSAMLPMWAFIKNFPNHWWRPRRRLSDFHLPDPLVTEYQYINKDMKTCHEDETSNKYISNI